MLTWQNHTAKIYTKENSAILRSQKDMERNCESIVWDLQIDLNKQTLDRPWGSLLVKSQISSVEREGNCEYIVWDLQIDFNKQPLEKP